jgi:hypothetical protein
MNKNQPVKIEFIFTYKNKIQEIVLLTFNSKINERDFMIKIFRFLGNGGKDLVQINCRQLDTTLDTMIPFLRMMDGQYFFSKGVDNPHIKKWTDFQTEYYGVLI